MRKQLSNYLKTTFMIQKITLFIAFITAMSASAQIQPFGNLTIFSENGDKFKLVLNGEVINAVSQTNLRVEELNQPYYNAKIIFDDPNLQQISKNALMISDVDGIFMDVTYKIRRDKNNSSKLKMNFFSSIPVDLGYIPAPNVHVIHYGQPDFVQTQVTQTTTTANDGFSMGVNGGGINMNINVNGVGVNGTQHSSTTTTTTVQGSGYNEQPIYSGPRCDRRAAMSLANFANAFATVKNQKFDDTRLKTAKQITSSNCLTVNQIAQIAKLFSFEDNTLEYAKFAFDYCVEPRNYFNLYNVFKFSSNVDELTDYVQQRY